MRHVLPAFAILIGLVGCGDKPAPSTGARTTAEIVGGPDEAALPTVRQTAETLLNALGDGKLGPMQMTPWFRAAIAPPRTDDQKAMGYNSTEMQKFTAKFEGVKFSFLEEEKVGDAVVFRGRAESPGSKTAFTLRLVKDGDNQKIDWFHRSSHISLGIATPPDATLATAQDVLRNFLDLVLHSDPAQAQWLMAPEWRKRIAPPAPGSMDEYAVGFLTQQMKAWRAGAVNYTITKSDSTADAWTFTVEFEGASGKVPHHVKLSKDKATGRWVVADFSKA